MVNHTLAKRLVVLGQNSKVWSLLKESPHLAEVAITAIGHASLSKFTFLPGDTVWVFSYSRSIRENQLLLECLSRQQNIRVIYISSAATNVTSLTLCYQYPTIKLRAQEYAQRVCAAQIVNIGWFYSDKMELPAGRTAATSVDALALAMRSPDGLNGQHVNLFNIMDRPFRSHFEKGLYRLYGALINGCGRYPCLMRPIDLALRTAGMRWYGYLYLSNKLWCTTI